MSLASRAGWSCGTYNASKLKKLVSTLCPVISWKPNCTSFARTSSRNWRYGCFFPGQVLATGASMLYFWSFAVCHLPVIISSGVSWVISLGSDFGFGCCFFALFGDLEGSGGFGFDCEKFSFFKLFSGFLEFWA